MPGTRGTMAAIAGGIAVAVMVPAGCAMDITEPIPQEQEWRGVLVGTAGWEHITGPVATAWTEGTTSMSAAIQISGDEPGQVRRWHVHHGRCADDGEIVGSDADYPPLEVGANGTATVAATVPVAIDPTADFHVDVHVSEEVDVIIACADLGRV